MSYLPLPRRAAGQDARKAESIEVDRIAAVLRKAGIRMPTRRWNYWPGLHLYTSPDVTTQVDALLVLDEVP